MLDNYDKRKYNAALKDINKKLFDTFEDMREGSRKEYLLSLKPGQQARESGGFYTDQARAAFQGVCLKAKTEAMEILAKVREDLRDDYLKAPSAEAVNVVSIINGRKTVSVELLDDLMTKYGTDCPLVYDALKEKAVDLGYLDFKAHPLTDQAESLDNLERSIARGYSQDAIENGIRGAISGAIDNYIDAAFQPAEG